MPKLDVLLTAMVDSCLSVPEIAEKAGVSVTIIYRMRKGYVVKMERFGKVVKALGLDCKDVIDYEHTKRYQSKDHGQG